MRVGIGAFLLHRGSDYRSAGVSVYTEQLLRHLPAAAPGQQHVVFHGPDAPPLPGLEAHRAPLPTQRPAVRIAWEQIALPLQIRALDIDVFHATVNVAPLLARVPAVVTLHDLAFLRYPDRFPAAKRSYLTVAARESVRRASRILAVSGATRRDAIDLWGIEPDRIAVVPLAAGEQFMPLADEEREAFRVTHLGGRPFILYVGTIEPRKNVDVLIRAYAAARSQIPHALVLAGAAGWGDVPVNRLLDELGLRDDVHVLQYVHPDELPLWYNSADLFAYPSAYEGFGLPVLEAMACGVPTVTSPFGALGELASDACLTVEPEVEALTVTIVRGLLDEPLRRGLRSRGLVRAAEFSWTRTARETAREYAIAAGDA